MTYKEILKAFKKLVREGFGPKCKDYCFECVICQVWRIVEDLESLVELTT